MADLLNLVDDHTEYFKGHIESLPAQERRVYLALADLWKPATTKEIADRARLETSKCSAQLARLIERGAVQVEGGTARRKQYYLTERLYNIYYLMRRSRGPDPLIEALIHLMESYYSPPELRDFGIRLARDLGSFDTEMQSFHQTALTQLMALPALAGYREELVAIIPKDLAESLGRSSILLEAKNTTATSVRPDDRRAAASDEDSDEYPDLSAAKALFDKAVALSTQNRADEALAAFDEVVCRFGESDAPALLELVVKALVNKGFALGSLDRPEEALAVYDEVIRRFGESDAPALFESLVVALVNKGSALVALNREEEALAACDGAVRRFGESDVPALLGNVAYALVNRGVVLGRLNRAEEALAVYEEVVRRFGESDAPAVRGLVVRALVNKAISLNALNRLEEALAAYDDALHQFEAGGPPAVLGLVALALVDKGVALDVLNRPEEALIAYEEVVRRFGESEMPVLLYPVAKAFAGKGTTLIGLKRNEDALGAYDEVLRRFGANETPEIRQLVAMVLINKGVIFGELNRPEEALAACDEALYRFGKMPLLVDEVATALVNKGEILIGLNRLEEALAVYGEVVHRFGESRSPALRAMVEWAYLQKAEIELWGRRYEAAIGTAGQVLDERRTTLLENRLRGPPDPCKGDSRNRRCVRMRAGHQGNPCSPPGDRISPEGGPR